MFNLFLSFFFFKFLAPFELTFWPNSPFSFLYYFSLFNCHFIFRPANFDHRYQWPTHLFFKVFFFLFFTWIICFSKLIFKILGIIWNLNKPSEYLNCHQIWPDALLWLFFAQRFKTSVAYTYFWESGDEEIFSLYFGKITLCPVWFDWKILCLPIV